MAKKDEQTELVLENRQVVGIFLGMALLCGIFFALGYVVGRNTYSPGAALAQQDESQPQSSEKPSALPSPSYMQSRPAAAAQSPDASASDTNLNFYNSVQQDKPQGMQPGASADAAAPETRPAVQPPPPGILVQVSALTRREDADSRASDRKLSERLQAVLQRRRHPPHSSKVRA